MIPIGEHTVSLCSQTQNALQHLLLHSDWPQDILIAAETLMSRTSQSCPVLKYTLFEEIYLRCNNEFYSQSIPLTSVFTHAF